MPAGNTSVEATTVNTNAPPSIDLPAVVFAATGTPALRIASLTVLDRLIVAIHRAGAGKITVVTNGVLPDLKRSRALGIEFETATEIPSIEGPVLVAHASLLAQPNDIGRCLESHARLLSNDGEPMPLAVVPEISRYGDFTGVPNIRPLGVARVVNDEASAALATKALWKSLTSAADGLVDRWFNRPCGRLLSKLLVHTPVTPNFVSVTSIVIGVLAAFFFAQGSYLSVLIGAFIFQLSAIIDCVDGDIARIVFKESALGKWIDFAGDQVVHVAVFAGIAIGVAKSAAAPELLWLGVSAVIGALLSFLVVLRGMRSPSAQSSLLKRLIDSATNRDFSVLVLLLACLNQLNVFLWLAAIGTHLFWLAALGLQLKGRPGSEHCEGPVSNRQPG